MGAKISPQSELETAWTLASVGATVPSTASALYIEQVLKLVVSMQGQIGCCVGCTFEEIIRVIFGLTDQLSWRFVYAVCKAVEGKKVTLADGTVIDATMYPRSAGSNDGTYPALAAMIIRKVGVPLAALCPNDADLGADAFCFSRDITKIPAAAFADAATRRAGADLTEPISADGIKKAIAYAVANKGGVAILRRIGDEYWTEPSGASTWQKGKLFPMRKPDSVESGHEEFLYGYLDITKAERADLSAHKITIESLIAKYPNGSLLDATHTETVILWLNHWSTAWGSTSGIEGGTHPDDTDGGHGYEFLDIWLPYIVELRVSVKALPITPPADFKYNFTKQMNVGAKGADVVALQHVLDLEGCYDYNPTDGTAKYTGNYGTSTKAGVKKLQEKYAPEILTPLGLKVGTGVVAAATLKWLQKHYGN